MAAIFGSWQPPSPGSRRKRRHVDQVSSGWPEVSLLKLSEHSDGAKKQQTHPGGVNKCFVTTELKEGSANHLLTSCKKSAIYDQTDLILLTVF